MTHDQSSLHRMVRKNLDERYQTTGELHSAEDSIVEAARVCARAIGRGGKILLFGNGGSAADAQHVAAELIGRFRRERRPLAAIALTTDSSIITALGNDYGFDQIFARQLSGLANPGDVAIGFSTSGSSGNVLLAVETAKTLGLKTIGITGSHGSNFVEAVDVGIVAPSADTTRIQECHIAIAHILCELIDELVLEEDKDEKTGAGDGVVDWPRLCELREWWRGQGKVVVWTNGCFDLLHVGHLSSLEEASRLGDVLIVGVNSDESVRLLKGEGRPIVGEGERARLVAALSPVNFCVILQEATPEVALRRLEPDIHCKGREYESPDKHMPEEAVVREYGGRIEFLNMVPERSTSALVEELRRRQSSEVEGS